MNIDSDNDHPMRTPPTNSPPSSTDEHSPPASPPSPSRSRLPELVPGVMMQVTEMLADDTVHGGKKQREEKEMQLARNAEMEKLLDKDWREAWLKRWDDDFDDKDMKAYSMSTSATPVTAGMAEEKGKEPEKQ